MGQLHENPVREYVSLTRTLHEDQIRTAASSAGMGTLCHDTGALEAAEERRSGRSENVYGRGRLAG